MILAVICLSLASPLTLHLASAGHEERFVTLDVCHATDASLSVNADSPVLYESPCSLRTLEFSGFLEPDHIVFTPSISSLQAERPPRS